MGNWITNVWDRLFGEQREMKIIIIGLDAAGKTTILKKMRFDEVMQTAPTIGVNTEDIKVKNVNIKVFDLAGQERMRNVWKYYYTSTDGIVFVVDASNKERVLEAKDELSKVMSNEEARQIPILVFANKQDLKDSLKGGQVQELLGLEELFSNKFGGSKESNLKVQECSAL